MRRTAFIFVTVILLSFAMNSCGYGAGAYRELADIESYAAERPDSALQALEKIDARRIRRAKVRARYCLLKSMTLDKNHIDVTDDSLINIAVKWYGRHGKADEKLMAYYYQGLVYQNAGDQEEAMKSFFLAGRSAGRSTDNIQKGLLLDAKAAVYESLFRFDDAIENTSEAANLYLSERDTVRYINSLLSVCSEYLAYDEPADALKLLSDIRRFRRSMSDKQINDYYLMRLIASVKDNDGVEESISAYFRNVSDPIETDWVAIAYGYLSTEEFDLGLEALARYRETESDYNSNPAYLIANSRLNELTGQYRDAFLSYREYAGLSDMTDMAIFESDAQYIESMLEATYKLRSRNLWIVILILSSTTFIFVGLFVSAKLRHLKDERYKLEKAMISYRELYEQAEDEKKNLQRVRKFPGLEKEIRKSIEERLDMLNMFITASLSKNLMTSANDAMDSYLQDRERFIYSTRLSFSALHPKFIIALKKADLTEPEIGYCCLYCLGMNGCDIAAYLGRKSFYNDSSAIRKKLGLSKHDKNISGFLREMMHSLD